MNRRKSNTRRGRELPPGVNVHALVEFLEEVDGHDIIKSGYFTDTLGFPRSFVADVEEVHVSRAGDPKQTIYKGEDIVSATRGVHDLHFVAKLYYDLGLTGAADKLGRGSQAREYARVILEHLRGGRRRTNPFGPVFEEGTEEENLIRYDVYGAGPDNAGEEFGRVWGPAPPSRASWDSEEWAEWEAELHRVLREAGVPAEPHDPSSPVSGTAHLPHPSVGNDFIIWQHEGEDAFHLFFDPGDLK